MSEAAGHPDRLPRQPHAGHVPLLQLLPGEPGERRLRGARLGERVQRVLLPVVPQVQGRHPARDHGPEDEQHGPEPGPGEAGGPAAAAGPARGAGAAGGEGVVLVLSLAAPRAHLAPGVALRRHADGCGVSLCRGAHRRLLAHSG